MKASKLEFAYGETLHRRPHHHLPTGEIPGKRRSIKCKKKITKSKMLSSILTKVMPLCEKRQPAYCSHLNIDVKDLIMSQ